MNLKKEIKNLTDIYNNQPVVEFSGFSPNQMYQLIHFPFGVECPIQLNDKLQISHIKSSPLYKISHSLLKIIDETGKLKLTARGNLPGKTISAIYDERLFPDSMIENGFTKLTTETLLLVVFIDVFRVLGADRAKVGKSWKSPDFFRCVGNAPAVS